MVKDNTLGSLLIDIVVTVVLVILALSTILPLWYTLCVSLSDKSAAAAGLVTLWPIGFNLTSYQSIVGDAQFFNSFWISIQRVVLGTGAELIATLLMAYPLSKSVRQFPARNVVMWFLIFAWLFSGGLIPWYQTMKSIGMINNLWGLVLGNSLPIFNVILAVNFFRNLPKEIEEAALIDGAGPWQIFLQIYVPLSKPMIATIALFSMVYHWNEFFNGLVLSTRQAYYPLQTYIQQQIVVINTATLTQDQIQMLNEISNQTLNAAKIFIAMIPILIIYPFIQRYFIQGITLGSVKE
jgi:multiple sugar transport system permease protein/putative aldouronate transport system permease protein